MGPKFLFESSLQWDIKRTGWYLFPSLALHQKQILEWGAVHGTGVLKYTPDLCAHVYSIPLPYQFIKHLFSYSKYPRIIKNPLESI